MVGFGYKMGVKNIKNVINIEIIFPISLKIPFKIDRIKPRPRVKIKTGSIRIGNKHMAACGE